MSAIPCLSYKRALAEEKKLKESVENDVVNETTNGNNVQNSVDKSSKSSGCPHANGEALTETNDSTTAPADQDNASEAERPPPTKKPRIFGAFSNAKIETVNENLKEQSLTVQQINDYCNNLFVFKNIRVMRFT